MNTADLSWQVAQVQHNDANGLCLRFERPHFCQRCRRGEGCGVGVFGALFFRRATEIEVATDRRFAEGDWVRVGIVRRRLALGAIWIYGLPLIAFVAGALPAHWLVGADLWRDLLALAGGLVAGSVAYCVGKRLARLPLNPVIEPLSCSTDDTKSVAGNH